MTAIDLIKLNLPHAAHAQLLDIIHENETLKAKVAAAVQMEQSARIQLNAANAKLRTAK